MTKIDIYFTEEQEDAIAKIISPYIYRDEEQGTEVPEQDKKAG